MQLKPNLALLVELRYSGLTAVAVENVLWQCIDWRSEALTSVCLLDLLEELPNAEPLWERSGDGPVGITDCQRALSLGWLRQVHVIEFELGSRAC